MKEQIINPIDHNIGTATVTTAVEAGKGTVRGAVKGGWIFGLTTIALSALAGFLVLSGLGVAGMMAAGGIAALTGAAGVGAATTAFFAPFGIIGAIGGALVGTIPAFGATLFGAGFGGVAGAAKGTYNGIKRVGQEQGAANTMQAEVAAYQAQAMTAASASADKYNFPAKGSAMNQADTNISSFQSDGRLNGLELQRA